MQEEIDSPLSCGVTSYILERDNWLANSYGPLHIETPKSSTQRQIEPTFKC